MSFEEIFDVAVIGGGLLGCFTARNLLRWKLSVALFEAREDVCTGISRANSAIIYSGCDQKPGTLKADMTVRANARFSELCRELDVPFSRCGSLMLSFGDTADAVLRSKLEQGLHNGVPGLKLLSGKEALALEPALSADVTSALYIPGTGTADPWELGIAAYENALVNGARAFLGTRVERINRTEDGAFLLETAGAGIHARAVINCAGADASAVHAYLTPPAVRVVPDAADYIIIDRETEGLPHHILQYEPEDGGKGVSAVPTIGGSLLIGPSERDADTAYATSPAGLSFIRTQAAKLLPSLNLEHTIRSFGAIRPNPQRADDANISDFVIDDSFPGLWSMVGIKTPGFTCADELGSYVAEKAASYLNAEINSTFRPERVGIRKVRNMTAAEHISAVRNDPDFGEIVCFCEEISKAEVLEAVRRGAVTIDGIKRRTGVCMGNCQGSRCRIRLAHILSRELGIPIQSVKIGGTGTEFAGGMDEAL